MRHTSERGRRVVAWGRWVPVLVAAALLGCGGCQTFPVKPPSLADRVPEPLMRLVPGDQISIVFLGAPNMTSDQTIRRDGRISLQLLGEVHAAGMTPLELRQAIAELAESQLQVKDVAVVVRTPAPVFVSGAVREPGRVPLTSPLSVLQAIAQTGGFDFKEAEVRNVIVIRYVEGRRFCYALNFEDTLAGRGDENEPLFYLKPLDIVYVPRTRIAKIDQWVDQHFNKLIPQFNQLGVGYTTKITQDSAVTF